MHFSEWNSIQHSEIDLKSDKKYHLCHNLDAKYTYTVMSQWLPPEVWKITEVPRFPQHLTTDIEAKQRLSVVTYPSI